MYDAFIDSLDKHMPILKDVHEFHVPKREKQVSKSKVHISCKIETISDLIDLAKNNPYDENVEYNINMKMIHDMQEGLIELNDFIGLENIKKEILEQILYCLQELKGKDEYMHMVLSGPPGTGKTELAKVIGKISSVLLKRKKATTEPIFKKATRSDLIAGYLGQTAIKTRKTIESAIGGVLFIDEAYALGHYQKDDSFAKECVDTLNEMLSMHRDDLIVIIAGYEEQLQKCFFRMNAGLESRFPWKYKIDEYTSDDLCDMFLLKMKKDEWKTQMKKKELQEWFKEHKKQMPYYGRDIEVLLSKCKIAHSRHIFGNDKREKRLLTKDDIEDGYKKLIEHREKEDEYPSALFGLYT